MYMSTLVTVPPELFEYMCNKFPAMLYDIQGQINNHHLPDNRCTVLRPESKNPALALLNYLQSR